MELFLAKTVMIELELRIKTLEPLSIGAGKPEVLPGIVDQPIVKDPITGQPVIPGSSLKGLFRSFISRILYPVLSTKTIEFVNHIFGSTSHASLVYFQEGYLENNVEPGIRYHIMINRLTGGVLHGPFSREFVPRNTTFKTRVSIFNLPPSILYLFYIISELSSYGFVKLGGAKSRGYGKIRIDLGSARISYILNKETPEITLPTQHKVKFDLSKNKLIISEKPKGEEKYRSYELSASRISNDDFFNHVEIHNIYDDLRRNSEKLSELIIKFADSTTKSWEGK